MRILYIHQFFSTPHGRIGTRSYQLAQELVKMGHEVEILAGPGYLTDKDQTGQPKFINRINVNGIAVTVINVRYEQQFGYGRRIWSFLKWLTVAAFVVLSARRPDVICVSSPPLTVVALGMLARMFRSVPFVFEMVDPYLDAAVALGAVRNRLLIRMLRKYEEQCFSQAAAVVTEHELVGEFMACKFDTRTPIETVYYPSDTDLYNPNPDRERFRRQWQVGEKVVAVYTGSMGRVHGADSLVEAATRLKDSHPDLLILAIGNGTEKQRLEALGRRQELTNLRFLPPVPKADIPDVLAGADIGLVSVAPIPILEYTTSNKLSDYCKMGLPVVLNYGGWQAMELDKYQAGLWSPMNDTDGFVENIGKLASDGRLREKMGANAAKMAAEMFDRVKMARRLEKILERAVGNRSCVAAPSGNLQAKSEFSGRA